MKSIRPLGIARRRIFLVGCSNIVPEESVELSGLAVDKGDIKAARKLYHKLLPLLTVLEGEGKYVQYVKASLELLGDAL